MANNTTKCPARYKNVGLQTFGNRKKVTDELLKQFCKNDEYLYQQVRKLLDLTDPESRKRFHPPYFEDEIKSFGYKQFNHNGKNCYCFDDGGEYFFGVNFNTKDDDVTKINGITYYNDESIIDFKRSEGSVDIYVTDNDEKGYASIHREPDDIIQEWSEKKPIYGDAPKSPTIQKTKKVGSPKKDSWCYGPYGSMLPNGWWYVGFDLNKNYNIKSAWRKKPYTEGIPTKCRAMTFTAQNNGYITKVNINIISESNKKSASPFSCELWKTKKGVPYGGAIARVEKSFIDSNPYTGAHIKTFKFNKKAVVTKGHKYAIVMRSPLSHRESCYRIAGWPRTCYDDYMKGSYRYGYAYQSLDNGKTWLRYDKNAYGILHADASTMPIAFGFEVFVQPTKVVTVKPKKKPKKPIIDYTEPELISEQHLPRYEIGNHYLYFKLPVTNPIYQLTIDVGETENMSESGNEILWDISFDGEDFNNDYLINDYGSGAGNYDLSTVKPTFVIIRCNLKNTNIRTTPILRSVQFIVHTNPSKKAYIRGLPYCPESESMLPACIWSEVNAKYEEEDDTTVKVDVVREVEAEQIVSIRKDTIEDLFDYYYEYYLTKNIIKKKSDFTDSSFKEAIQGDNGFIDYLKNLKVPIYVISSLPMNDSNYYEYFESIDLPHYPAYPLLGCDKILGEYIIEADDFKSNGYNVQNTEYTFEMSRDLTNDLVNISFQQPMLPEDGEEDNQEGVLENELIHESMVEAGDNVNPDYRFTESNTGIVFLLDGDNITKNLVFKENGEIKCFKTDDGTEDGIEDIIESDTDDPDTPEGQVAYIVGNTVELVVSLRDKSFIEHMNYDIDYNNKKLIPKTNMRQDLSNCELRIKYNPLWVRDLTSENLPLKMDLWTETFEVSDDYLNEDGKIEFHTRVAPRDNLREVVLWDDEDTLTREELIEDVDFHVDYQYNKIIFDVEIENGTPITIRYTPNLTDTSLSLAYRLDRITTDNQAYVYDNHFTTRT